jgi:adenosylcobinamide kinase/adenosylcobinamide-phosphate guanylyltransferase
MKIFISGGCKNGKSYYAQHLAKCQQNGDTGALYYVATMLSADKEDDERIKRHREEREGWGFTTIEQQRNIEIILSKCDCNGSFLLDSLTALLANEMFRTDGSIYTDAYEKIAAGICTILDQIENIVIVSDYIYGDALPYDSLTEEYRKSLAVLDRLAAKHCDTVLEVCHTQVITHKGEDLKTSPKGEI